jgi:uncharacterized protein (TIGR03435 family)
VKRLIFLFAACLALVSSICAQSFDVASIRVNLAGSAGGEGRTEESVIVEPGSLLMKNVTLRSSIRWAYGVRDFQISGGPGWISSERYDISAKSSMPAGEAELREMLQTLLAQRFQLNVRRDSKELPVYAMVVAQPKAGLKAAAAGEEPTMLPQGGSLEFRNVSMADLAERLGHRPLAVDRPVVDETGLRGGYDFTLHLAENADSMKRGLEEADRGGDSGVSIMGAMQQQLGLKLQARKAPLPVLTIESAERNPGEN